MVYLGVIFPKVGQSGPSDGILRGLADKNTPSATFRINHLPRPMAWHSGCNRPWHRIVKNSANPQNNMFNQTQIQPGNPTSTAAVVQREDFRSVRLSGSASRLERQIAPRADQHRCPSCHSIIYSRRHALCGVCSQPLPGEFLFSIPEARRIEQLMETERVQHRQWLAAKDDVTRVYFGSCCVRQCNVP